MKKLGFILLFLLPFTINAQKLVTKTGKITFYAESELKDAKAISLQARSALDKGTGDFAVMLLIKSFEFEKALMQQHFNADMDSENNPKASFEGKIKNIQSVDFTKDGTFDVTVSGTLTIRGISKELEKSGTVTIKGNKITASSKFSIDKKDFKVPARSGVNDIAEITVSLEFTNE